MDAGNSGVDPPPLLHPSVLLVGAIRLEGFLICTPPELNSSIIDSWGGGREVEKRALARLGRFGCVDTRRFLGRTEYSRSQFHQFHQFHPPEVRNCPEESGFVQR